MTAYDRRLESPRHGRFTCAIGCLLAGAAIGLTVWDAESSAWWWIYTFNAVILGEGAFMFLLGRREIRRARYHHAFMEAGRAFDKWLANGGPS